MVTTPRLACSGISLATQASSPPISRSTSTLCLYYLHASTPSGRFFSAPWIVAPAQPAAEIAVLASNITWNAYNNFGGRSNYASPIALPDRPIVNARLELKRYTDANHLTMTQTPTPPSPLTAPNPSITFQKRHNYRSHCWTCAQPHCTG